MAAINAETRLFVSISARSSSNGVYFYNALFQEMGLNAVYLSTPTPELDHLRASLNFFSVKGAAIAAPFKAEAIRYLDELSEIAKLTESVNSIRLDENGRWFGHNTDEAGLRKILEDRWQRSTDQPIVVIYGSGGVISSAIFALRRAVPLCQIYLQARNTVAADRLAEKWAVQRLDNTAIKACDLFINAAAVDLGDSTFLAKVSSAATTVFDLRAVQFSNPFEIEVQNRGQQTLRGFDFYLAQFAEQFAFFTGQYPSHELLTRLAEQRASKFK